jgi:hypothetical protein
MRNHWKQWARIAAGGLPRRREPRARPPGAAPYRADAADAFDQLTRAVAEELPRREVLRRLGGGLAGVLLASLGLGPAWGSGSGHGKACSERALSRCVEAAAALCSRQQRLCLNWAGSNAPRQGQCAAQYDACGEAVATGCGEWFGCPSGQTWARSA